MKKLALSLLLSALAFGAQATVMTYEDNFNSVAFPDGYRELSLLDVYSSTSFAVATGSEVSVSFYYSAPKLPDLFLSVLNLSGGVVTLVQSGYSFPKSVQTLDWVDGTTSLKRFEKSNPGESDSFSKQYSEIYDGLTAGTYTLKIWAPVAMKIDDVKVMVTSVPEPESYGMFLVGLCVMGGLVRRRRNNG